MPTVIYRLFIYTIFINIPKWDKSYFFKKHFEKKFFFYLRNSMYISDNNKVTITE